MRLPRQASVVAFVCLTGVLVAYGVSVFTAQRPARTTLQMAPLGTTMIGHVEVPSLLASPLWEAFVGGEAGISRMERVCGLNPLESLRTADAYVVGSEESPLAHIGFLAHGDIDHERLLTCVSDVLQGDGGGVHEVTIEGVRAIASEHGDGRAAFLSRDGILGGDETLVRELIRLDQGTAQALSDPALARLWGIAAGRRHVVVALHVPVRWRGAIARYLADLPALRPVERAAALAIGASLEHGIGLTVALACERDADAVELAASLEAAIAAQLADGLVALSPVGAALRRIEVEPRGRDVIMTLDLAERQLTLVVSAVREALDARRERAEPGPRAPAEPAGAPERLPDEILRPRTSRPARPEEGSPEPDLTP